MKTSSMLLASAALLAVAAGPPALAGAKAAAPEITYVEYSKDKETLNRSTDVQVDGKRIEAVKVKAAYGGERVTAGMVQDGSLSGKPWVLDYHDKARRQLLNLMEASIEATGAVTLKVIAKNDAATTKESVEIVFSQCHMDPPAYPFTCVVEP